MGWISNLKSLPVPTRRLLVIGIVLALAAALPLFIWGIITQRFLITQRAQLATGEPPFTPAPSPFPNTCEGTCKTFNIRFKFVGVTDGSADGAKVAVRFANPMWGDTTYNSEVPPTASYVAGGVYLLSVAIPSDSLPVNGNYSIILKGEKHEQVKFCQASGQADHCKASAIGQITIPDTTDPVLLDFTGIALPPGDTPSQDGFINYVDYDRIKLRLSKISTSLSDEDRYIADLNYDGVVDNIDMLLFRKTLEIRHDEY